MRKIITFVLENKKAVIIAFLVMMLTSFIAMSFVETNYDMTLYLPENEGTRKAINLMREEFGYPETALVLVEDISVVHAIELKQTILEVNGVKSVTWLDDVTDVHTPADSIESAYLNMYYKDGNALFDVEFWYNGFNTLTKVAVDEIREKLSDETFSMAGDVISSKAAMDAAGSAILRSSAIAIVIVLVLLTIATTTWLAPVLFLSVIGVAILFNSGTNVVFNNVSNITISIQALLQLAVSMDYSLFLFHRYQEERENGLGPKEAVINATVASSKAIVASCLTTVAGFAALIFMRYRIGADMGLVLLKGVLLSLFCVLTLLPLLILIFNKWIDKLSHRPLLPRFGGLGRLSVKLRRIIVPIMVLIAVPMFLAQGSNDFQYGEAGILGTGESQYGLETKRVNELFGESARMIIMVPAGQPGAENMLAEELAQKPYVISVTALNTVAGTAVPESVIPESALKTFRSDGYTRMILSTTLNEENPQTFGDIADLRATLLKYYETGSQSAGKMSSVYDIKTIAESDYYMVNLLSICAVILIILISFRNFVIPFILTLTIEAAIFINMGIPYFQNVSLSFIGYLIVSSIQLGATIDYAILLSDRYVEFRKEKSKFDAAITAIVQAGPAIFTSALIFGAAGISLYFFADNSAVQEIGLLVGRGALISGAVVLFVAPQLLVLFDKAIRAAGFGRKGEIS